MKTWNDYYPEYSAIEIVREVASSQLDLVTWLHETFVERHPDAERPNFEQFAEAITELAETALAEQIYIATYDSNDKRHAAEKIQAIYEWLHDGDSADVFTRSTDSLVAEWLEFDEVAPDF